MKYINNHFTKTLEVKHSKFIVFEKIFDTQTIHELKGSMFDMNIFLNKIARLATVLD